MKEELKKPFVPQRVAEINAQIAASPLGSQGISQSVNNVPLTGGASINSLGAVNIPPTLSSDTMKNETPLTLPSTSQPTTTASAVNAGVESKFNQIKTEADKLQQDYYNRAKDEASLNKSKAEEYLGIGQKTLEERLSSYQTPEFLAKKQASDTAYKDIQTSRASELAEVKSLDNLPLTTAEKQQRISEISSKYAYKNAQLSLTYDIANKDYASAKESIDNLAQLKMEAYQPYINYYTQLAQNNQNIFNKAELDILNAKRDEYKTAQTQAADFEKTKGELMLQAKANGADNATIQAMARATDQSSLIQSAGQYAGDVLGRTLKQEQILTERAQRAKINADTAKVISESIPTTTKQDTEAVTTINDISNILSSEAFDNTFGLLNFAQRNIAGTAAYGLSAQINNLTNRLALAARGQLKGQGAVSDFEGRMLKEAQTALKINMSPDQARKELAKVRGALATSSGLEAPVKITAPDGSVKYGKANQNIISEAIKSGYTVEYQ